MHESFLVEPPPLSQREQKRLKPPEQLELVKARTAIRGAEKGLSRSSGGRGLGNQDHEALVRNKKTEALLAELALTRRSFVERIREFVAGPVRKDPN